MVCLLIGLLADSYDHLSEFPYTNKIITVGQPTDQ